jgi:phage terminase small subunit
VALTEKQRLFCLEYLLDLNGTQAAIRAGYSPDTAKSIACENLTKPDVRAFVDEALTRRVERLALSADRVLQELLRLAMVDVGQAFYADGRLRPLEDIPEDVRRAISGIDVEDRVEGRGEDIEHYTVRKVRFHSKVHALELLGQHLKLFTKLVETKDVSKLTRDERVKKIAELVAEGQAAAAAATVAKA